MTELFFVDSNLFVYRRDASESEKQLRAAAWIEALWRGRCGRISLQVLEEFYVVTTRKLSPGLPREDARDEVTEFMAWRPLPVTAELLATAWQVEDDASLSFWDSLIVGAAQLQACRYLLSEDLNDGQEIGGVAVIDPFAHVPSDYGL